MWKSLFVSAVLLLLTGACYAQRNKEDSLQLKKTLKEGGELKLNQEAVKQIRFGNDAEVPQMSKEKRWLRLDESLPRVTRPSSIVESDSLYNKKRMSTIRLSLRIPQSHETIYQPLPLDTLKITMGMQLPPPEGISLGNGVRVNGGLFSGLDLLQVFTREFWQFRKKRMRARTFEALDKY